MGRTDEAPDVTAFLANLQQTDNTKHEIMQKLRDVVHSQYPGIDERIIYGGIMFSLAQDCGGIFPSKHHVSFEFGQGYLMDDPDNLLEGTGKFRRHLKIRTPKDVENKNVAFFVQQFAG